MDPTKRKSRPLEDGIAGKRLGEISSICAGIASLFLLATVAHTAAFFASLEVLQ